MEFPAKREPKISHVSISLNNLEFLQKNLLLIFTKIKRKAVEIEKSKIPYMTKQRETLRRIRDLAIESVELFESKAALDLVALGKLLNEGWHLKKQLSPLVSNAEIDEYYERAKKAGAKAGKILGAGGGGFLMLLAPPESHPKIIEAFAGHHSLHVELGAHGSEIIFDGRAVKTGTAT